MFKPKESTQSEYEFVSIDELVPEDHLLRLIDKYIDPLVLFKMMFIGYIYGIRPKRQLEREIRMNIAYRFHHSTISWNRQHRFKDTDIFQNRLSLRQPAKI